MTESDTRTLDVPEHVYQALDEHSVTGESLADALERALELPGEYVLDCGDCGFEGGTYNHRGSSDPPVYCPMCGATTDRRDVDVAPAADARLSMGVL